MDDLSISTQSTRCGLVALVGRPNVGKSTLLNHLLGQKLSITSRKPQTTRHNLLGIDTQGENQAIYVDTPGIHAHQGRGINRHMVKSATSAIQDVDIVVMLVEQDKFTSEDEFVLREVERCKAHKLVALNKVDRLDDKELLLPALAKLQARQVFSEYFPISALQGTGHVQRETRIFAPDGERFGIGRGKNCGWRDAALGGAAA